MRYLAGAGEVDMTAIFVPQEVSDGKRYTTKEITQVSFSDDKWSIMQISAPSYIP